MQAYRFLPADHRDLLSGFVWTTEWGAPTGGVVAYRREHLHHWIAPELWEVELDGPITQRELSVVAPRGRLVVRVAEWDEGANTDFLRWCAERYPAMNLDTTAQAPNAACCGGYVVARAAGIAGARAGTSYEDAEAAERVRQREWVLARLGVTTG